MSVEQEEEQINNYCDQNKLSNPIYDSIEYDVQQLEKIIENKDNMDSNTVTPESWRTVLSPSSSISSISSVEDDYEVYSSPIEHLKTSMNDSNCQDKTLDESSLDETRISLQEINEQIGIASELTPGGGSTKTSKRMIGLETIHEGHTLETPPKNGQQVSPPILNVRQSNALLERLVRD